MSGPRRTEPDAIVAALLALQSKEFDAMVDADVTALGAFLTPTFTLTHMTGYEQTRADWLTDIDTNRMTYHRVDLIDSTVTSEEAHPTLTARTRTEASIWGAHGTWRLQLRSTLEPRGDGWLLARTVASTW